ncbi:MAG: sugar phosphate isomerase/epimerase [Deltaproteobacteria bacterium]|nr:sugar phosphate isomerase/epimerase [Deltaproteobacteria bacterium]MBW2070714.1 sugar phosphate isomerase/epimerase [Deltaproteobacteria bacterium]
MVFGYSTNAFVKMSLYEAVERIAALGFKGVEIMCDRPHLYPADYSEEDLARLSGLIKSHNLKLTNLNSFTLFAVGNTYLPSWIEPEEERRKVRIHHTVRCLKLAKFLGCANISVPPGGPQGSLSTKEALALFHQGIEQVAPVAEELGVKILVEPEPDLLLENSSQFAAFINDVASSAVGLNFDVGHFFCVGEDPCTAFEKLFQWVGHVHLEDIGADRMHNHLIAGHGVIPFLAVFETIARLGYRGDISLELYPYVDMPEEAGRESLDYLRPIFQEAGLPIS